MEGELTDLRRAEKLLASLMGYRQTSLNRAQDTDKIYNLIQEIRKDEQRKAQEIVDGRET